MVGRAIACDALTFADLDIVRFLKSVTDAVLC